jgi:hypothetical protein
MSAFTLEKRIRRAWSVRPREACLLRFVLGDLPLMRFLLGRIEPGGLEGGLDLVLQLVDLPLDPLT